MVWDLLLYVPTVAALLSIGAQLWFTADRNWSYLLFFLGTYFFLVGANRVLKTRLMILPAAPVRLAVSNDRVSIGLRSGQAVDLVKDVKFYSEVGGKTFALTGMDLSGRKQQHIFHRGQFADDAAYQDAKRLLDIYR